MKILQEILIKSLILSNKNNNLEKPFKTRKTNAINHPITKYQVHTKAPYGSTNTNVLGELFQDFLITILRLQNTE